MIIGDIGEAVFAMLVKTEYITNFGWKDYIDLIQSDRERAYFKVIELMDNLELEVLKEVPHKIIHTNDIEIKVVNIKFPFQNHVQ